MLLGSVSRYAAMHASCPVIVVRKEDVAPDTDEVVVGIRDPHDTAISGIRIDSTRRNCTGATLVVFHSWNPLPAATWRPANSARLAAEADLEPDQCRRSLAG